MPDTPPRPTDAITAAVLYRRALEDIMASPHKARAIAEDILRHATITPPGPGEVSVTSGYGHNTRKGFVTLSLPPEVTAVQLTPAMAREIARHLIEGAEAAVSDELLVRLLVERIGLSLDKAAAVLNDFRSWRDEA